MEKPLLTALLFLCMHLSFPVQPASVVNLLTRPSTVVNLLTQPASVTILLARPATASLADTASTIATTLVLPVLRSLAPTGTAAAPPSHIPVTIRIFNNSTRDLSDIYLEWELQVNGIVRQKGTVNLLIIAPQHSGLVRLPAKIPSGTGEEAFLQVRYRSRKKGPRQHTGRIITPEQLHPAGRIITEQQLLLKTWDSGNSSVLPVGELSFNDENNIFTIRSAILSMRFDKQTGWLQQYEVKGFRLLEDTPVLSPDFWQPAGNSIWLPAGDSSRQPAGDSSWQPATDAPRLQLFSTSTGNGIVIVRAEYLLPGTLCRLHLSYTINAAGEMQVEQSMDADSAQKGWTLPRFGMQWALPPGPDSVAWYGPGTQEKDNNRATAIGIYRQTLTENDAAPSTAFPGITPALRYELPAVTAVRWWKITGRDRKGLLITADRALLNISVLRRSAGSTGLRLNIDYPASLPPSGLPNGNYHYSYKITPVIPGT